MANSQAKNQGFFGILTATSGSVLILTSLGLGIFAVILAFGTSLALKTARQASTVASSQRIAQGGNQFAVEFTKTLIQIGYLGVDPTTQLWRLGSGQAMGQPGPVTPNLPGNFVVSFTPQTSTTTGGVLVFSICDPNLLTPAELDMLYRTGNYPTPSNTQCQAQNRAMNPQVVLNNMITVGGQRQIVMAVGNAAPEDRSLANVASRQIASRFNVRLNPPPPPSCNLAFSYSLASPPSTIPAVIVGETPTITLYNGATGPALAATNWGVAVSPDGTAPVTQSFSTVGMNTVMGTISGTGGTNTCSTTVESCAPPTCSLTSSRPAIDVTQSAQFWVDLGAGFSANCYHLLYGNFAGTDGTSAPIAYPSNSGGVWSDTVSPTSVGTYTFSAKLQWPQGATPADCGSKPLIVYPLPTCSVSAPSVVDVGQSFTVQTNCQCSGGACTNCRVQGQPPGPLTVTPGAPGPLTYTSTVTDPQGGTGLCSSTVTVVPRPTCNITPNNAQVAATLPFTATVNCSCYGAGCSTCKMQGYSGASVTQTPGAPGPETFNGNVTDGQGVSATCTSTVTAVQGPHCNLAGPTSVQLGDNFTIAATCTCFTSSCSQCAINGTGSTSTVDHIGAWNNGAPKTFTATVTDTLGQTTTCSKQVAPIAPSCSLSAQPNPLPLGQPVTYTLNANGMDRNGGFSLVGVMNPGVPNANTCNNGQGVYNPGPVNYPHTFSFTPAPCAGDLIAPVNNLQYTATVPIFGGGSMTCTNNLSLAVPKPACNVNTIPSSTAYARSPNGAFHTCTASSLGIDAYGYVTSISCVDQYISSTNCYGTACWGSPVPVLNPPGIFVPSYDTPFAPDTVTCTVAGPGGTNTCQGVVGNQTVSPFCYTEPASGNFTCYFLTENPNECYLHCEQIAGWDGITPQYGATAVVQTLETYECLTNGIGISGADGCCMRVRTGCFAPETEMLLADGTTKRADLVRKGDELYNPVSKTKLKVTNMIVGLEKEPLIEIGYADIRLHVSSKHPMLTMEGIKVAKSLVPGELVMGSDGRFHAATVVRKLPLEEGQAVFNFVFDTPSQETRDHMIVGNGIISGDYFVQERMAKAKKTRENFTRVP